MHMNELVSYGIEYKITQDKGTHVNAPSFVILVVSVPFRKAMHVLPSSCRYRTKSFERHVTLIHSQIHATMGSVQLNFTDLGPLI